MLERKHIQDGIDALQMWLDMGDCECETATHTCGKPKIERALEGLQKALAACDESQTVAERAIKRIKDYTSKVTSTDWDKDCVNCCESILAIISEEEAK